MAGLDEPYRRVLSPNDLNRVIGTAVIHHNDFMLKIGGVRYNGIEAASQPCGAVIANNDD
ncbi:MAG: hypothetical protein Kow0077_24570 [Anaerolineae bacterium]